MKIQKFSLSCAVAVFTVLLSAMPAWASIQVGNIISFSSTPNRVGDGGEFAVNRISPNAQNDVFRTFCVELSEPLGFGTNYMVGGITTTTVASNKALTTATAALYRAFRSLDGTSGGNILGQSYDRTNNEQGGLDGRAMQLAIWHTMGWDTSSQWTSGGANSKANEFAANAKAQAWVNAASIATFSGGDSFGWVRVLNVVGTDGTGNFQDQLVLIPEPGSFMVWGVLALAGVGFTNRRRKS